MENRIQRRQRERQAKREGKVVREGLTVGQLKEAEAELADGAVSSESSRATTLAVLAHSWYALDHQREASRMTYERIIELRKGGRELKTDNIVQQYAEAKVEIIVVEAQIVELLGVVADEDGDEVALGLLGAAHMNMMNGIGVRFPEAIRDRLAKEAGLLDSEPEGPDGGSDSPASKQGPTEGLALVQEAGSPSESEKTEA